MGGISLRKTDGTTRDLMDAGGGAALVSLVGGTGNHCTGATLTHLVKAAPVHGLEAGDAITFGSSLGGVTAGNTYYVKTAGLTATAFQFSTSGAGGAAFNVTPDADNTVITPSGAILPISMIASSDTCYTMVSGVLRRVVVNTAINGGTITLYDDAGSVLAAHLIGVVTCAAANAAPFSVEFGMAFTRGLIAVASVQTLDFTVVYD